MKLENVQEQLLELSPLKLSQQFSRDELMDLRDQLKAKRAAMIEAKDKCSNGNSIALMNIELSQVNSMLTRINQTVTLLDQDAKIMKKNNHSAQELAMRFFKVAEKELDTKTFKRIKEKAMVA
ncbi:hypothetical protein [Acinetobacter variabilis]|uniref:hypothetical protein n=1 Tax=Acinetobacter variabilis TaxID=70346 RepID=UPI001BB75599|nr:hypothetical protein [Acinetobacter variabilis]BCT88138.1 hypothetical protein RYU24_05430 [Acinetobacter variabilis]